MALTVHLPSEIPQRLVFSVAVACECWTDEQLAKKKKIVFAAELFFFSTWNSNVRNRLE